MRADPETESALLDLHDRFCAAIAARDTEAVMAVLVPDDDIVMVTSEAPLLHGHDEARAFLDDYARGSTTYSWTWDRREVSAAGDVAWLLAVGTETAATADRAETHPYRMTAVGERRDGRWLLTQLHGSSPHEI